MGSKFSRGMKIGQILHWGFDSHVGVVISNDICVMMTTDDMYIMHMVNEYTYEMVKRYNNNGKNNIINVFISIINSGTLVPSGAKTQVGNGCYAHRYRSIVCDHWGDMGQNMIGQNGHFCTIDRWYLFIIVTWWRTMMVNGGRVWFISHSSSSSSKSNFKKKAKKNEKKKNLWPRF